MPGTRCAIATCSNTKQKNKDLHFHRFPREEGTRAVWVQRCHRKDKWNPNSSHVCSEHFASTDYKRDLQAELLNLPQKPHLKPSAIPSRKLPLKPEVSTSPTSRGLRLQKRHNKSVVAELLEKSSEDASQEVEFPGTSQIREETREEEKLQTKYSLLERKYEDLKTKLAIQNETVQQHKSEVSKLEKSMEKIKAELATETKYREKLETSIKHVLSKAQLQLLLKEKKKVIWSVDDISNAFAIRYFSKRAYVYLREKKKYPLPAISSLQRWASRLNLREGILKDVLRIMEIAANDLTDLQRIVVLQFDEVKIASVYEYDKVADEVVGPHSQMQVALVRGLFAKFKQPIFVAFDTKMTAEILLDIIGHLHVKHYKVVACVSDCGGGNLGLWRDLGISIDKTHFQHPNTDEKIYFFADTPHLLKLVRNWLLDTGFVLQDGKVVTSEPLKHLVTMTDTEISSCHKLNRLHLECMGSQRQNVSLAAQLLSHHTATALLHYTPGPEAESAIRLGHLIEKINNWFDVMNSFMLSPSVKTKSPYGLNLEAQNVILDEMYEVMKNMRCINKNVLQIFQKGILISITSLKDLYEDLKAKFPISYLLTHRVNQDALENFFSQIRGRGGFNDHPSPMDAIYRMRMIILGKNPGVVQKKLNTADLDADEYLITKVLTQTITVPIPPKHTDDTDSTDSMSVSSSDQVLEQASTSTAAPREGNVQLSESDGLEYLSGWIARKFKNKYPSMGTYTYKMRNEHSYNIPNWICHLSYGGLTHPSDEWSNNAKMLNNIFLKINKKQNYPFRKGKHLVAKMTKFTCKKNLNIPTDVLRAYFLQRVYIRMKYLNEKKKLRINLKRKSTTAPRSQQAKKMKKIIS